MSVVDTNARQSDVASHNDDVIKEQRQQQQGLQEKLTHEMETHITDGCVSMQQIQEQVGRIQQFRQELSQEAGPVKDPPTSSDQSASGTGSSALLAAGMGSLEECWQREYYGMLKIRDQQRQQHTTLIQHTLQSMEKELTQERACGVCEGELSVLQRERSLLLLQVELLSRETHTAETHTHTLHTHHLHDLHTLRQESLQVFRAFRGVLEERRRVSEERYRTILLEAIQDAVLLSAHNQQLQAQNTQLQKVVADLKRAQAQRDGTAESTHTQQTAGHNQAS